MNAPAVSVNMIAYNTRRYIAEAVESILDQDFRDFEFVIVDDGSTDGTRQILEGYAGRDARIRLVGRPNRGIVASRNEALGLSRGDLVAVLDSDDVALPGRLALQAGYLRDHPEVVCVGGSQLNVDADGWLLYEDRTRHPEHEQIEESIFRGMCPISHSTVMMRRQHALAVGGYGEDVEQSGVEDVDLWLRLGERGRLAVLPDLVVKYRYHDQSISDLRHDRQREGYRSACRRAFERRGLEPRAVEMIPWRQKDPEARYRWTVAFGWTGFLRGDRGMARHYAMKAVRMGPLRPDGSRLLACALLRRRGDAEGAGAAARPPADPAIGEGTAR